MEPPPHFDLEQAIAAWRQELASHPGPAPEDLRVLEAHLRDGFAALQGGQLSDEEAFLIARHRVGPPAAVAVEFTKAAPRREWESRVFWLIFGIAAFQFWAMLIIRIRDGLDRMIFFRTLPDAFMSAALREYYQIWSFFWAMQIVMVPLMLAAYCLVRGVPKWVATLLSTRLRVATLSIGTFLFIFFLHEIIGDDPVWRRWDILQNAGDLIFYFWTLFLIGLLIWLAPSHAKARTKTTKAIPV